MLRTAKAFFSKNLKSNDGPAEEQKEQKSCCKKGKE